MILNCQIIYYFYTLSVLDSVSINANEMNKSILVAIKDKMVCITSSHNCTWNTSIEQTLRYVEWTGQKMIIRLNNCTEEIWTCECCQNSCGWKNAQIKCRNDDHATLTYEMRLTSNCNVTGGSNTNNIQCRGTNGTLEKNLHCEHNNNCYITLHAKLASHAAGSEAYCQGRR